MISNCNKIIILFGGTFMKATTEIEIEVSKGRIIETNVMPDGKCKLVIDTSVLERANTVVVPQSGTFVKVEASKLCFDDKFLKHQPKTKNEQELMNKIKDEIKRSPKDFWRPKYDPSFNKTGTGICYHPGMAPAVGKSFNWWEEAARKFYPERKSQLGTKSRYIAFLAVLIKTLVANGWTVANAWNAVCNDSKKLGNYCNSDNAYYTLEYTGRREVYDFFDLANTCKFIADDEEKSCFWIASGCYWNDSRYFPLKNLERSSKRIEEYVHCCGWLILEDIEYQ